MEIYDTDIMMYGFVTLSLFRQLYGSGTTLEQMEQDAENHGWIRAILPNLKARKEGEIIEVSPDWSEVGL